MTKSTLDQGLIGYWKLVNDCKDYSSLGNHGCNHGVEFTEMSTKSKHAKTAAFDGTGSYIKVPHSDSLSFGTGDFTLSVYVKCRCETAEIIGDIISTYDPGSRKGINLSISAQTSVYSSVSDVRSVYFGIDNASVGTWEECGKPSPTNTAITNLVVYKGELYAGISDAVDPLDACRVFRYEGGTSWSDCGRITPDLTQLSVHSMIVHKGDLYAGTGVWDWLKLESGYSETLESTRLYRYEGGQKWHDCGLTCEGDRVFSLASYRGNLFASDDGKLHSSNFISRWYRCDDDNNWHVSNVPMPDRISWFLSMIVYHGNLYASSRKHVYRYDGGTQWSFVGDLSEGYNVRQIHTMGIYCGDLYAGTWPEGRFFRYDGGQNWADCGFAGIDIKNQQINEINDMIVYNGKLYVGVIPKGEVWRYESEKEWSCIQQLVNNPQYNPEDITSWGRVLSMTQFRGRMYAGTASVNGRAHENPVTDAGSVFSIETGKCVSYDHDIGSDWKHIVAVREQGCLKLYIDGVLNASSTAFHQGDYDVANNKPLLIGFGAEDYFMGCMNELRIYDRVLSEQEIMAINKTKMIIR
ncbi:LamG domain-containing protein [Candidatus Latescibacterota bacterium]